MSERLRLRPVFFVAVCAALLSGCATPPPPAPRDANGALSFAFTDHDGERLNLALPLGADAVARSRAGFQRLDGRALMAQVGDQIRPTLEAEIQKLSLRFPDVEFEIEDDLRVTYSQPGAVDEKTLTVEGIEVLKAALAPLRRKHPGVWFAISGDGLNFAVAPRGRDIPNDRSFDAAIDAAIAETERHVDRRVAAARGSGQAAETQLRADLSASLTTAIEAAGEAATQAIADQGHLWIASIGVLPNYPQHARRGVDALADARNSFTALTAGLDRRAMVERLLAFFQSIPYDALQTRYADFDGAGFALPVALFAQNRGDCDTKSVAMASVLQMLAPDMGVAMLLLDGAAAAGEDGHALLAVELPPQAGDRTIAIDGEDWVLIEPTGPLKARVGATGPQTDAMMRDNVTILPLFAAA